MELKPKSWEELQKTLFHDTWDDRIRRYRSPYIYRGMNNSSYSLDTSLMRLGGPYAQLEHHLLRNFMKYAHGTPSPGVSTWNWLALAQHHGLPTRMLDWTYSPYVALHFATNVLDRYDSDGVIWCLNYVELNQFLPAPLQKVIGREESNAFTAEMLDGPCKNLHDLDRLDKDPFLVFLEPPSLDNRIVNQFALFSMLSDPALLLDKWLKDKEKYYFKIIISKELKWEIRDKLDQANITERVLFPGLSGVSMWLKRHYSSR